MCRWAATRCPGCRRISQTRTWSDSLTPHLSVGRVVHEVLANLVRPGVEVFAYQCPCQRLIGECIAVRSARHVFPSVRIGGGSGVELIWVRHREDWSSEGRYASGVRLDAN